MFSAAGCLLLRRVDSSSAVSSSMGVILSTFVLLYIEDDCLLLSFRNLLHSAIFDLYSLPPQSGGIWQLRRVQECVHQPLFTEQV